MGTDQPQTFKLPASVGLAFMRVAASLLVIGADHLFPDMGLSVLMAGLGPNLSHLSSLGIIEARWSGPGRRRARLCDVRSAVSGAVPAGGELRNGRPRVDPRMLCEWDANPPLQPGFSMSP